MQGKRRVRRHAWLVGALLLVCFCGLAASQSRRYKSGRRPPHRNTSAKMSARTALPERVQLEVASSTILGVTSMPYVCVTMDWWPETKCDWGFCGGWTRGSVLSLDLQPGSNDRRDLTLALSSLAPAALRVGGSLQDIISYETEFEACGPYQSTKDRVSHSALSHSSSSTVTAHRWDMSVDA